MEDTVQVNLYDAEANKIYPLFLSPADAERCENDAEFAQLLLYHAKNEKMEKTLEGQSDKKDLLEAGTSTCQGPLEGLEKKEGSQKEVWSYNETLALISAYDSHKENFNVAKKRKFVWQDIANELTSNGFGRTSEQCEIKWRNLLRTYKNVKDTASDSGRGAGKFRFFDQLDEILGDKPSTSASHTFSSTKVVDKNIVPKTMTEEPLEFGNEEFSDKVCDNKLKKGDEKLKKLTPKRKRMENLDEKLKKKSEDLMNMKINYLQKKKDEEENRELRRQKKIELKEKMLDIEERKVALLEKYLEKETQK